MTSIEEESQEEKYDSDYPGKSWRFGVKLSCEPGLRHRQYNGLFQDYQ